MKSKALLLLFIFLLNTATGFACALRMSNLEQEEATEHHHGSKEAIEHHHESEEATVNHNDEHRQVSRLSVHQQQLPNGTYIAKDDACCQAAVNNFNALAKVAPQSNHYILLAPFIYIGTEYQFFLKTVPNSGKCNQSSSRYERRRPPTQPIRISIQSFQI